MCAIRASRVARVTHSRGLDVDARHSACVCVCRIASRVIVSSLARRGRFSLLRLELLWSIVLLGLRRGRCTVDKKRGVCDRTSGLVTRREGASPRERSLFPPREGGLRRRRESNHTSLVGRRARVVRPFASAARPSRRPRCSPRRAVAAASTWRRTTAAITRTSTTTRSNFSRCACM